MKKFFSGISIIVILMIVMSSIIQFHHHDKNGNIIFAVTTITCNGNVHNHSHSKHSNCCGCEHHHDHDCGTGENCSAHLGDYQATKQTNLTIDDSPTILLFASITDSEIRILNNSEFCTYITFDKNTTIVEGVTSGLSLRAPPIG